MVRRAALLSGIALAIVWSIWRIPHLADDVRYALAPPWGGSELARAADGSVVIDRRVFTVEGSMAVDCMPGIALVIIPAPECRGPDMSSRIVARGPRRSLPNIVHARVESLGTTWETDLIDLARERYYDPY